ncbi:MAG TPA: SDR family oxidoreductase [Flavisolibacter sp.]|nr:SDR family oxidoreductase [Flavisolibacter sp.]
MRNTLLFGGTGSLGTQIARELYLAGYRLTAVVRNEKKAAQVKGLVHKTLIADITDPGAISGLCRGFEIVVSSLGKPVSPNDRSKPSFQAIDLDANTAILNDAVEQGVRKFIYISAFGAERYRHLEYFRVHHEFEQRLRASGIDYSILRPPALFSAFRDLVEMARKGRLMNMGKGERLTNPIDEADLARICLEAIDQPYSITEAGGQEILSRKQINQLIQDVAAPGKKIRTIPLWLVKGALPLLKLADRNAYDKMAFFTEVMEHDTVAPRLGTSRLKTYLERMVNNGQAPKTGGLKR